MISLTKTTGRDPVIFAGRTTLMKRPVNDVSPTMARFISLDLTHNLPTRSLESRVPREYRQELALLAEDKLLQNPLRPGSP